MKNLKKFLLLLTLTLIIIGCKNEVKETSDTSNDEVVTEEVNQKIENNAEDIKDYKSDSVIAKLMFTEEAKTFVRYLISANLIDKLSTEEGPFTILSPTNEAFSSMDAEMVEDLQDLKNNEILSSLLKSHIIEGNLDTVTLVQKIKDNNGKFTINSLSGKTLTATKNGSTIVITDENGTKAAIGKSDIMGSNGVVHILDTVLGIN